MDEANYLFNKKHLPQIVRLLEYLQTVQDRGRCVFFSYNGHVDNIDIRICPSKVDYDTVLWGNHAGTLSLYNDHDEDAIKEIVDEFIEEIEAAIDKQKTKENELRQLEELKAKYEPKEKKEEVAA